MPALTCPHCGTVVILPDHLATSATPCPNCQRQLSAAVQSLTSVQVLELVKKLRQQSGKDSTGPRKQDTQAELPNQAKRDTKTDAG